MSIDAMGGRLQENPQGRLGSFAWEQKRNNRVSNFGAGEWPSAE